VVLRGDRAQPPIADPHDRGGASVMGVVLVSTFVVEESNRECQVLCVRGHF
jgi:hypothetical protein